MKIIDNILSEQSLKNIEDYWSEDKEHRLNEDIAGVKRDVVMLSDDIVKKLTGDDLKNYYIHSGFLGLAGEPYKVHCDLGNNPITHNLCINLVSNEDLNEQAIVLLKQKSNHRMILVDDNTDVDILKIYEKVKYIPVYANNINEYVINTDGSNSNFDKEKYMNHVWQDTLKYLDIDVVIPHKYNRGIEFDAHTLHCGASSSGDHKRIVLYVRKYE